MANPVLVEVTRGNLVESRHRGAVSVIDGDGKTVLDIGHTALPVFPRSAVKSIQALPLVESGAAEAFGFGDAELSLASSSHSGEDDHVTMARSMLERAGKSETDLECGGQWSSHQHVLIHQARIYDKEPGAICNNCSGKHSGFICTAAHMGLDPKGYIEADHPVMANVKAALEDVTGAAHMEDQCGRDGCSIPTYAVPLSAMAHGFAKMATGNGLAPIRAKAATQILNSCMNKPFYMSGTKRFCNTAMEIGNCRLFCKTGAEGVFCGAIPELGFGIAIKSDDGATRAAEAIMAATLARLFSESDPLYEHLSSLAGYPVTNRNHIVVGELRTSLPV